MSRIQALDYSVNLMQVILWQFDQSPNLIGIIQKKQEWYDLQQSEFWSSWHDDVFNLRTANDFGLSVWAIILDIPIFADTGASPSDYGAWGFDPYGENFDHGNFATAGSGVLLTTAERRSILRLRYHQLTTNGSVSSINAALVDVFGIGNAHVQDNYNMSVTYKISLSISAPMLSILQTFDVLPRPAGVSATIEVIPENELLVVINENSIVLD